jgi:hypothetical protein
MWTGSTVAIKNTKANATIVTSCIDMDPPGVGGDAMSGSGRGDAQLIHDAEN